MEIQPINDNWIQTNAYLLNDIKQLIDKYNGPTINVTVEPTPVEVTVNPTPISTEITLEQNFLLSREFKYIHNPLPILTPLPNTKFNIVTNYIPQEPIIIDIDKMAAYQRVCGPYNPIDSKYAKCMQCTDAWLAVRPDGFEIKDLTSSITGCYSTEIQRVKNCGCIPPSSIVDRKAVRAYHQCKEQNNIK